MEEICHKGSLCSICSVTNIVKEKVEILRVVGIIGKLGEFEAAANLSFFMCLPTPSGHHGANAWR